MIDKTLDLAKMNLGPQAQSLENGSGKAHDVEAIKKLSEDFESIFLQIVLKSMRESVPKSKLIDGGNGEEIFRSMLDSEYAKSLAAQRSTGLAESIQNHLLGLMQPQKENVVSNQKVVQKYQKAITP